jgi:phosphoglycolate phosphatase/putative hydrolase of the HAD superfamily
MCKRYIKPNTKAFIFDVDGTLYQQEKLRRHILRNIARYFFTNPWKAVEAVISILSFRYALEKMRSMSAMDEPISDRQLELASDMCFINIDKIKHHVNRWMENEPLEILDKVKYPYSDLFFREAKTKGYRLAALSDYPLKNKLEALGWEHVFDIQMSSMDSNINRLKPDPVGIIHIMKQFGLNADEVIYIGDRHDIDTETASNAGVDCIIIGTNNNVNLEYGCNVQTYLDLYNGLKNI